MMRAFDCLRRGGRAVNVGAGMEMLSINALESWGGERGESIAETC
jgi:hypothetical protein